MNIKKLEKYLKTIKICDHDDVDSVCSKCGSREIKVEFGKPTKIILNSDGTVNYPTMEWIEIYEKPL